MLKRIAIYCIACLSVVFLVLGYFWLKEWPERAKASSELKAFLAEETAQKTALESLGDVSLDLSDLSLARLEQKLHSPPLRLPGAQNTTRLGWACGGPFRAGYRADCDSGRPRGDPSSFRGLQSCSGWGRLCWGDS